VGLLEGSTVLCLEQILIDTELFRRGNRLHRGIGSKPEDWLDGLIRQVGPGGSFLAQRSTRDALHGGEWYLSELGLHDTHERWQAAGRPTLIQEAHERVDQILGSMSLFPSAARRSASWTASRPTPGSNRQAPEESHAVHGPHSV
jgi:trimethylamine--corrinoid protein Co-methyltransferase